MDYPNQEITVPGVCVQIEVQLAYVVKPQRLWYLAALYDMNSSAFKAHPEPQIPSGACKHAKS